MVPDNAESLPDVVATPLMDTAVMPPVPSTLSIVIVASLAGEVPPNAVPKITKVSVGI